MAAAYVYLFCLLLASVKCQKTVGFNDYTPAGTEREIDLLYRDVELYKENSNSILRSIDRYDAEARAMNLPVKRKIFEDISAAMNNAANLANKAGFPLCAARATAFTLQATAKYQTQIHILNDLYVLSAGNSKGRAASLIGLLNLYSETVDVNLMRTCQGALVRIFGQIAITNCYKTQFLAITNKIKAAGVSMAGANSEFEVTTKRFNDFINGTNNILATSQEETDKKVEEVLECAKLNARPIVLETLNKIEQIKAPAATYINGRIEGLTAGVNSLIGKLDLKKNLTESLFRSSVQPFYSIGSFGKILFPKSKVDIETEINKKINLNVENAAKKFNSVFTVSTTKLNNFLSKVNAWALKYNVNVGYFTESNLTALCVPKSSSDQLANRDKITQCLNDLLFKFTTISNEGRADIDKLLAEFVTVQAEADGSTQTDASVEAELIATTKADVDDFFKTTFGILPNKLSVTAEIGKLFEGSGATGSIVIDRVTDIKNELNKLDTLAKTTKDTINTQIQTVLNPLTVAISDIKKINPYFNFNVLTTTQSKLNAQIQANLTAYFDRLKLNANTITLPSLNFDYNLEFQKFQIEMNKCFPSGTLEFEKLFACLSPIISNFNSSLSRAERLTENAQTDIKLLINNFPNEIKQLTTNLLAEAGKQVSAVITAETSKARNTIDYSNDLIDELKEEIANKIKTPVDKLVSKTNDVSISLNKDSVTYNDNIQSKIIDPLINAYNKSYQLIPNQFLSFDGRLDIINNLNINKNLSAALSENYFFNRKEQINKVVNETVEDIDLNLGRFTVFLNKSLCPKSIKAVFLTCISTTLNEFKKNITNAATTINTQNNVVGFLLGRLNLIQNQTDFRLSTLMNESKVEIDNQSYLIDRSQQYLKTVLKDMPNRVSVVNKINAFANVLGTLNTNFQNTFKTAIEPFRVAVNNSEQVNAYVELQQNKIKSKLDQLKVLIELGKLKLNNIDIDLNTNIESYKDFKINCISDFKTCVNEYYDNADSKLSAIVGLFNNASNSVVGSAEAEIEILKQDIENILKETAEKTQSEINKTSNEDAMKQLIQQTISAYNVSLNSLSPVFNDAYNKLNKLEVDLKNVVDKSKTNANLNVTLTVGGLTMVKSAKGDGLCNYIDVVGGAIEASKAQLQLLQNVVNKSRAGFDVSYLNVQCDGAKSLVSFRECLQAQIVLPNLDFSGFNNVVANIAIRS